MSTELSSSQLGRIEREGERLKAIMRRFCAELPENAQTMGGLARWSNVSRSTAQRIFQVCKPGYTGSQVICGLPSPHGISQLIEKMTDKQLSNDGLAALEEAKTQLAAILRTLGKSQNQLKQVLKLVSDKKNSHQFEENLKTRQKLFELNQSLSRESIGLSLGIDCITPNCKDPRYLSEVVVAHRQDINFQTGARSFVQTFVGNEKNYQIRRPQLINKNKLKELKIDDTHQFLLKELTQPDFDTCFTGHGILGNSLVYDLTQLTNSSSQNSDSSNNQHLSKITLGHIDRSSEANPLTTNNRLNIHGIECRSPTRKLIFISLVERSLAARATARTGLYTSSQRVQEARHSPEENWSDRFVEDTQLVCFSPAEDSLAERLNIPEIEDLIESCLTANQLTKEDVIGYYLKVDYPLWLATYRIYFEFE